MVLTEYRLVELNTEFLEPELVLWEISSTWWNVSQFILRAHVGDEIIDSKQGV